VLNDIHGSHGKTCTIDEAADVAAYVDIVQVERVRNTLLIILLGSIFFALDVNLSENSIIINGNLRISS